MENAIEQQPTLAVSMKEVTDQRYVALSKVLEKHFNIRNMTNRHLFTTDVNEAAITAAFINSFPAEEQKRNSCSCCLRFIKQYGRLVFIITDKETGIPKLESAIWSAVEEVDPYFRQALEAMKKMVESAKITGVWYSKFETLGNIEVGGYNHLQISRAVIPTFSALKTGGQMRLEAKEDYALLTQTVNTLNVDVLGKVIKFFKNDAQLRNRKNHIEDLEWLASLKQTVTTKFKDKALREITIWFAVASNFKNRTHIGQNVLGKFIGFIEEGLSFDLAKNRYLEMTDDLVYKRAQSAPSQGNVMRAEKVFEALGLGPALKRRFATLEEMLYKVWLPKEVKEETKEESTSLFGHLKTKEASTPKVTASQLPTTINGGTLTWVRFVEEILPNAENMFVRLSLGNMNYSAISTCTDPEAEPLLVWDKPEKRNPFCAYRYEHGSRAQQWGLVPGQLVEIKAIITEPQDWEKEGAATGDKVELLLVLEGAWDQHVPQIPLFGSVLRHDLHEVRSTLENFFKTGKMEPQPEDLKPFGGLTVHSQSGCGVGYEIHVVADGVKTRYFVDRYN